MNETLADMSSKAGSSVTSFFSEERKGALLVGDLDEYKETTEKEVDEMQTEEDKSGSNVQGAGADETLGAQAAPAANKKRMHGSTATMLLPRPYQVTTRGKRNSSINTMPWRHQ